MISCSLVRNAVPMPPGAPRPPKRVPPARASARWVRWCRGRDLPVRPVVRMEQLWGLAVAWYATRLEPDSRRPGPDEMRSIFAGLDLAGDFWDPQADAFE